MQAVTSPAAAADGVLSWNGGPWEPHLVSPLKRTALGCSLQLVCLLNELQRQFFFLRGLFCILSYFFNKIELCCVLCLIEMHCWTSFVMSCFLQMKHDMADIV